MSVSDRARARKLDLDVEVLDVERVVFNELPASLDIFSHEGGEDVLCFGDIFKLHLEQRSDRRIHGRLPQLGSRHFTQALVALDLVLAFALLHHIVKEFAGALLFYRLPACFGGLLRRLGWSCLRRLRGCFGLSIGFVLSYFSNRFARVLDQERRLKLVLDEGVLHHHLLVLGTGGESPIDTPDCSLRVGKAKRPGLVFLIALRLAKCAELELLREGHKRGAQFHELRRNFRLFGGYKIRPLRQLGLCQQLGDLLIANALVDFVEEAEILVEMAHKAGEGSSVDDRRSFAVAHHDTFRGALDHDLQEFAIILDVLLKAPFLDLVEGWLRDIHVTPLDQLRHVTEEEGQQQRTNVRPVNIGVSHQDQLAVAQLRRIEIILANAAAERRDHGADFLVAEHLVVARLFHVENLALQRKDRLEAAVASLLGGTAGRLALDQIQLATLGIALGAIGQLTWQAASIQSAFAARQIAGFARCLARATHRSPWR